MPYGVRTFLAPLLGRDRLPDLGADFILTWEWGLSRLWGLPELPAKFVRRQLAGRLDHLAHDGVDQH